MLHVSVFLESGNVAEFRCTAFTIRRNECGDIIGYEAEHGNSKKKLLDLRLSSIEGIVVYENEATE
jgi:hypothetical protein